MQDTLTVDCLFKNLQECQKGENSEFWILTYSYAGRIHLRLHLHAQFIKDKMYSHNVYDFS